MYLIYLKFFNVMNPEFLAIVNSEEEVHAFMDKHNLMMEKSGRRNNGMAIMKSVKIANADDYFKQLAQQWDLTEEQMQEINKQLGGTEDELYK